MKPQGAPWTANVKTYLPGVAAACLVGLAAFVLARWTPAMSPLIWAILLGAAVANVVTMPRVLAAGITFSSKHLLRLAVGLLGIRLAFSQMMDVGVAGLTTIVVGTASTFVLLYLVGQKLGLSRTLATLVAAGTSICGAAAIVAMAGVVDSKDEETAVGVGTVTLLGTVAMLTYPLVGQALGLDHQGFGIWAGASIHEVAQVVAAGFSFDRAVAGGNAVDLATVVKLGRVMLLAPMAVIMSLVFRAGAARGSTGGAPVVPWFVTVFLIMVAVRSSGVLPEAVIRTLVTVDTVMLAVAMGGLGLDLRWAKIRAAGLRPIWIAGLGSVFLAAVTLGLVKTLV
jgi:uncharacterized integral membrane protein (TIGR00698 family)